MNKFNEREELLIQYVMKTLNIDKKHVAYDLIRSVVANTIYELDCQGYIDIEKVKEHIKLGYLTSNEAKEGDSNK